MATNQGSHYTLAMNSKFESDEWELNEAWGREGNVELAVQSSPAIESPLDCIQPITISNSQHWIGEAIELDHVSHSKSNSASGTGTLTECQPDPENPASMPRPLGPRDPEPALNEFINSPSGSTCMSPTDSTTSLHSLRMDLDLVEPDNDHHEDNSNNGMDQKRSEMEPEEFAHQPPVLEPVEKPVGSMSPTESTLSSHSLHMDWDPEEDDNQHQSHKSHTEDRSAIESEEFTHQSLVLGPVEDPLEESDSEDQEELLVPEFYTLKIQHLFQEVTKAQSDATNLKMAEYSNQKDPSQTKQPEEPLLSKQENVSQDSDANRPPKEVLLSDKTFESRASAKGCINVTRFGKVTEALEMDFGSEVERPCHGSSGDTCFEKNNLVAGDDRDIEDSSKPPKCSASMKKRIETHGLMQHKGGQYNKSGPMISGKLSLCGCKQCGCYFGSETTLGHHQKVCQGVIYCESCMVTFAYKDALANLIPPAFVCKDCGLSFPSDCGLHTSTDKPPSWIQACSCRYDPDTKVSGHHKACRMSGISLLFPRIYNTCKCAKKRSKTNKEVEINGYAGEAKDSRGNADVKSVGRNMLGGAWSSTAIKCCQCNSMFKPVYDLFLHLQIKDGKLQCGNLRDENLLSSLTSSYACYKSCDLYTRKERVQNYDGIVALQKKGTATQKPITLALLSAKSTDRQERVKNHDCISTAKSADCKEQMPRKKGRRVRDRKGGLLDHTYSAKPPCQPSLCEICGLCFPNCILLENHAREHVHERSNICPPQKPITMYPMNNGKYAEETKSMLHNSKKGEVYQLLQRHPKESIKPTSKKTDSKSQPKNGGPDQFQQSPLVENIKHTCTSKKTDSQSQPKNGGPDQLQQSQLKKSMKKTDSQPHQRQRRFVLLRGEGKHQFQCLAEDKMAFKIHDNSIILANVLQCIWCKKYFSQRDNLKQHKCKMKPDRADPYTYAGTNSYLCEYCGCSVADYFTFFTHMAQHRCIMLKTKECSSVLQSANLADCTPATNNACKGRKPFWCQICSKTFLSESQLLRHKNMHHIESLHPVPLQQQPYPYRGDLNTESRVKNSGSGVHVDAVGCSPIPESANIADSTPEASSTSIRSKPFVCQICSKAFAFESQLLRHRNVHRLESRRPVPKQEPPEPDTDDKNTRSTVKMARSGKKGSIEENRNGWRFNMADISPEASSTAIRSKPFVCKLCSKAFAFESQLLRHRNVHRLESRRPVPKRELPEPDKYDESNESVGKKKKVGKLVEKYGWRFKIIGADGETKNGTRRRGAGGRKNQQQGPKSAPRWGRRARSKVEVKRYFCRACDKGFPHPWRLRKHMAIHSHFNCDKCDGLSFASSVELNNHLLAHIGQSESARPEQRGPESSAPKENTKPSAAEELKSLQSGQPKESNEALMAKELKSTKSTHSESNSKSLIAQELESVHRGHPKGRAKSSKAKGLPSKQSGQSKGSNKSSKSNERKSGQSVQPKKRKSMTKKLPIVQSRQSNGGYKSSTEKTLKSGHHRQPKGNTKSSSRTKDSKCLKSGQPDVSASVPKISTVGDKRFYCNLCSLGFQRSSQLKNHMVIHSDLSCDKSDGLTFPSSAELKSHMPTHTDQFKCPKCETSFASQKSLKNHVASHSDPVPHVCDVCLFAFKSLKSLKTHQIMNHFPKL